MAERPKRPMSAYLLWLCSAREEIKAENPGLKVTEIARKAGEIWRSMGDDSKATWVEQAAKLREEYYQAMEEYKQQAGSGDQVQRGKGNSSCSSVSSSGSASDN